MKIITTHKNPDFDGFASAVAAKKLFPDHEILLSGVPAANLKEYLGIYAEYFPYLSPKEIEGSIESLIVVDTSSLSRLDEKIVGRANEIDRVVVYDHHPEIKESDIPGEHHHEAVGATVTLLLREIKKRMIELDKVEATLFSIALHEDTGNFLYTTTTPEDLEMAAWLLEKGANLEEVADFVSADMTAEQKLLFQSLIDSVRVIEVKSCPVAIAQARIDKFVGGLNLIVSKAWEILGHDTLICVVQMGKKIFLVGRTSSDEVDLTRVMGAFGGGGHYKAASTRVDNGRLESVIQQLVKVLAEVVTPALKARDIMSSPVRTIFAHAKISEANTIMERTGHNGLPVIEGNRLIGIVVKKDIDKAMSHGLGDKPVKSITRTKLVTVDVDTPVSQIIEIMRDKGIGRVPVLENGILVGIITRTDIIRSRHLPRSFRKEVSIREEPQEYDVSRLLKERLPKHYYNLLVLLGNVGSEMNMPTYIVGGFVRDLLLGHSNYDFDIVVEGDGIAYAHALEDHFDVKVVEHPEFFTAAVFFKDGFRIDVATARTEYYEAVAELPKVEISTIKKDLYRRDFSINAMAIKLNPGAFGRLLDFFECRKDLENGVIRVLYNLSFVEDPTRIIRAIRFEKRFGFTIEQETLEFLREAVEGEFLEKVTGARIREEIEKLLAERDVPGSVRRMGELGVLKHLFPEVYYTQVLGTRVKALYDFLSWARHFFIRLRPFYALIMVLMEYSSESSWSYVEWRYGLSGRVYREFKSIKPKIKDAIEALESDAPLSCVHKYLKDLSPEGVAFIAAHTDEAGQSRIKEYLRKVSKTKLKKVNGNYLKKLGIKPGPRMREILEELLSVKLDGKVTDETEEEYLRKILHI
ncbi:MAG: tRNA nucleotidyltransferase [Thermotogae bacterium]|nr:MAG: tRNA nucleotidyltransferase [Thermotogota bacterium]